MVSPAPLPHPGDRPPGTGPQQPGPGGPEPRMWSGRLHGSALPTGQAAWACDWPGQAWLSVGPLSLSPAPLKLSKHGPGAQGGLPRNSPGKGWPSAACGWRKRPLFAFLQLQELPSLCVFALLSSSCLLWKAGRPVDPGPRAPDTSRPREAARNNSSVPGLSSQNPLSDSLP